MSIHRFDDVTACILQYNTNSHLYDGGIVRMQWRLIILHATTTVVFGYGFASIHRLIASRDFMYSISVIALFIIITMYFE